MQITQDTLFSRSRAQELVTGRNILYYLARNKMGVTEIQNYLKRSNYPISQSSILNGINSIKKLKHEDADYKHIINKLERVDI